MRLDYAQNKHIIQGSVGNTIDRSNMWSLEEKKMKLIFKSGKT